MVRTALQQLGTKESAKRIRKELRQRFPGCKFSVRCEFFSMGSSITIALMKADKQVVRDFNDISDFALFKLEGRSNYTREQIQQLQEADYHQLNHHWISQDFDADSWNNGVFLTEDGHNLIRDTVRVVRQYHFDDSDIQTDYFNCNFYVHVQLGKWNKPFVDGAA